MEYNSNNDTRIILTLDAGGTNFIFSAIQGNKEIVNPVCLSSNAHNLEKCINTVIQGFKYVNEKLSGIACAISFAFPGPADYKKGIIGDLPNFKAFNDGVPLGPILEDEFNLPVFINNDGNLFAYGEALSGYLPELNKKILKAGGIKNYNNLIGITLGTGFGCGVVLDNNLLVGDNSCDTGIFNTINKYNPNWNAEESVSTRALQRVYAEKTGVAFSQELMPKDIYDIAKRSGEGNQAAALESFRQFGEALGSSLANILVLIDGIVVIGGGITSAWEFFSPAMFKELNRKYENFEGIEASRLSIKIYNLEDNTVFKKFAKGRIKKLYVGAGKNTVSYDDIPRTGIGISRLGASKAIALGAYTYALQQLDNQQ